jgi:LmbE family N-acetylglucosaminyl deacetylase
MRVLVVSVHPDDETLGCGGTILKHRDRNDEVFWLILTEASDQSGYSREFAVNAKKQVRLVSEAYQFKETYSLGFPTTRLHALDFSMVINNISQILHDVKPEIIYTVNRSDIHTDHQIAAKAIMSCTKSFRNPFIKRILMYECISETEIAPPLHENAFLAHVYSDITEFLEKKIEIMRIYESELQPMPMPRSLENVAALARFRGATVSVQYAEAFMLLRELF